MSAPSKKASGDAAERRAQTYLEQQGLRTITCNYRCRWGEIDLIMRDDDALVFVEVRYRQQSVFGDGAVSVNHHKQQRLIKTAQTYLQQQPGEPPIARFDVVALDAEHIDWIRNAFEA